MITFVKGYRQLLAVLVGAIFTFYFFFQLSGSGIQTITRPVLRMRPSADDVRNRTLGFQKVFAIGLPSRRDKHDALTIASALSEFDITWHAGVKVDEMSPTDIPENWNFTFLPNTTIASRRAHLNLLQHIVDNRIETALIMEDDVDWDWFLKDQLESVSAALRELQGKRGPSSPYGDDWEVFWPGSCSIGPSNSPQDMHYLLQDPTVLPPRLRRTRWRHSRVPDLVAENYTRSIFQDNGGMCTYAYAVTYKGAQKILMSLSIEQDTDVFDDALNDMCRNRHIPLKCYGVYPAMISTHQFAGSASRASDINSAASNQVVQKESTRDIVFSTVMNMHRILSGAQTVLSQWPDHTLYKEMNIHDRLNLERVVQNTVFLDLPVLQVEGLNGGPKRPAPVESQPPPPSS